MSITKKNFGKTKNGESVDLYVLKNASVELEIINYGGIIRRIITPDKYKNWENITLGYENLSDYEINNGYFGCITGRVAGRIKEGKLLIGGTPYQLEINNGKNNLHGGIDSLNKKIWTVEPIEGENEDKLILKYSSPHMENGFPGKVNFVVTYTLRGEELKIDYLGTPDRETYISLTNHTAFNLSGDYKRDIYNQKIKIVAEEYLKVDEETIPISIEKVEKTPMDLRKDTYFKEFLNSSEEQIKIVNGGIDHGFILSPVENINIECSDELSGRKISVKTDQPAVVLYTGNYLESTGVILGEVQAKKHLGFCIETQDYPDVFNIIPEKIKIYSPEKPYTHHTAFKFYTT